ncbi:cytochrome P450 [Falsihalocynthiibacter sp. S25ZX9]|uniref:cytochrome P450 n=1 Tax=Falsihalocynthiibacter sp. S25ZX9 TaxID=3240870 RepID=UPI003510B60C
MSILSRFGNRLRNRIPPGELEDLEKLERTNRFILSDLSAMHGPIFKIKEEDRPQICVVGLELGRALLKTYAESLQPVNIDITPVLAAGFMRHMTGSEHIHYRAALTKAVNSMSVEGTQEDYRAITLAALQKYSEAKLKGDDAASMLHDTLSEISTGFLIRLFFGLRPETVEFAEVCQLFQRLGPHGVVWNVGDNQKLAFDALVAKLGTLLATDVGETDDCVISTINNNGQLDSTMLGNLIYMVEIGRYDMAGLFLWICKNAGLSGEYSDQIRNEADVKTARGLARAFVLETLRLDQSERLIRRITQGFTFEGFKFPKDWRVRICMWESHKLPDKFENPFDFAPSRFMNNAPSPNVYSPFGLDHHQCPLASVSVALGARFLTCLVGNFRVLPVNDGPSVRGPYHWEPPVDFYVELQHISGGEHA